jgi:hypothetical protein
VAREAFQVTTVRPNTESTESTLLSQQPLIKEKCVKKLCVLRRRAPLEDTVGPRAQCDALLRHRRGLTVVGYSLQDSVAVGVLPVGCDHGAVHRQV